MRISNIAYLSVILSKESKGMKCNEAKNRGDRGMLTRTMRQGILSRVVMCLPVCSVLLLSSCVQCWLGSVIIAIQMQTKDT